MTYAQTYDTTFTDALLVQNINTTIEYRHDENGELRAYAGDNRIVDVDWATTSNIISFNGDGESYEEIINTMKDDIQMLKDEIENLKMKLLEN